FPGVHQEELLLDFLKQKYAAMRFDLVVTLGPQALDFVIAHGQQLAGGAPIVFSGIGEQALENRHPPAHATGIVSRWDFAKTLDLALSLQPDANHVVVVSGSAPFDKEWEAQARRQFHPYESRISFEYLSTLMIEDLLNRVSDLPKRT